MATTNTAPPVETAELVRLAEEWAALRVGNAEDMGRRGEILVRLHCPANPWRSAYNAARFVDFVRTAGPVGQVNLFLRMLQSQAERYD